MPSERRGRGGGTSGCGSRAAGFNWNEMTDGPDLPPSLLLLLLGTTTPTAGRVLSGVDEPFKSC